MGWIYRDILEILVKNLLNVISFLPVCQNFWGMKIWGFEGT